MSSEMPSEYKNITTMIAAMIFSISMQLIIPWMCLQAHNAPVEDINRKH
jgi:hypothetical protein